MKKILFSLTLLFALYSCNQDEVMPVSNDATNSDPVYLYLKSVGFKDIKDAGSHYVVEEDMLFPKDLDLRSLRRDGAGGRTDQYYTGLLVGTANQSNIRVMVDPSASSLMSEINGAVAHWNAIPNSAIRFNVVTSGAYDILVKDENLGSGICGQAEFAHNGAAGTVVKINKNFIAGNSYEQRRRTVIHEFGHTLGLRHTNWLSRGEGQVVTIDGVTYDAINVPGATGTDASSLMNGGQCGSGATVLSTKDVLAVESLYPAPTCYFSTWSLTGAPASGTYLPSNTTITYNVVEDGPRTQVSQNIPKIGISSYSPINVIYKGVTYYIPGNGTQIQIDATTDCASNPSVSAPITFQKISGSTTVIVALSAVSQGHAINNSGYNFFNIY